MKFHVSNRRIGIAMNVLKIAVFATLLLVPMANAEPECKGGGADPSTFCAPGLEWDSETQKCRGALA